MIRVVMFDLGFTLIDEHDRPFPHVEDALTAISGFKTANGKPLRSCLVSDFKMATPATAAKVTALFNEYLGRLDGTGLRPFFEPVSKRVTISTQADAEKPDRKIFETALQRLGAKVSLSECLLVTEEPEHVDKARKILKMTALQFRSKKSKKFDFDDWAEAPGLIANIVAPDQHANAHAAIKAHLAAKGIDMLTAAPAESSAETKFSGRVWSPISVPGFDDLQDVHVAIPVEGKITRGRRGEVRSVAPKQPSAEQIAEATSFVRSLATHGQIAGHAGKKPVGRATHQIETDEKGNRRLVRKRFTAV